MSNCDDNFINLGVYARKYLVVFEFIFLKYRVSLLEDLCYFESVPNFNNMCG